MVFDARKKRHTTISDYLLFSIEKWVGRFDEWFKHFPWRDIFIIEWIILFGSINNDLYADLKVILE